MRQKKQTSLKSIYRLLTEQPSCGPVRIEIRRLLMRGRGFTWDQRLGVAGKIIKLLEQNDAK